MIAPQVSPQAGTPTPTVDEHGRCAVCGLNPRPTGEASCERLDVAELAYYTLVHFSFDEADAENAVEYLRPMLRDKGCSGCPISSRVATER